MCNHRCPESSRETEAPRRCWSCYRSNLCTAGPAERQKAGIIGCVHLSVHMYTCMCPVLCVDLQHFFSLHVCEHTVFDPVCMCSGGEYLAVLRQDHRLGVAELLLDIMQGARVMELGIGTAERHRAEGVRRGGTLHALHRG